MRRFRECHEVRRPSGRVPDGFGDFYAGRVLAEIFEKEKVQAFQPDDGRWEPPLEEPGRDHKFQYNLPSDPNKACNGKPCYHVDFHEELNGLVGISFSHEQTGYADRATHNKEVAQDTGRSPAEEQMSAVLKAVGDYIAVKKPKGLEWAPTRKRFGNRTAREKVYKLWSIRLLMGEYVPTDENTWMRADVYDQEYTRNGYPPFDPAKYKGKKGYEEFVSQFQEVEEEKTRKIRDEEERRMADLRRGNQARLDQALADPEQNPNGVKVGDLVWIGDNDTNKYKVHHIEIGYPGLIAYLLEPARNGTYRQPSSSYDHDLTGEVSSLSPATEQHAQRRAAAAAQREAERVQEFIGETGFKIGMRVMSGHYPDAVIQNIRYDARADEIVVDLKTPNGPAKEAGSELRVHRDMTDEEKELVARHNPHGLQPGHEVEDNYSGGWGTLSHFDVNPAFNNAIRAYFYPQGDRSQPLQAHRPRDLRPRGRP